MAKLQIVANFLVWVPAEPGKDRKVEFTKGMVLDADALPAGQSAEDWIAKGLAKAVSTAGADDESAQEAGAVV